MALIQINNNNKKKPSRFCLGSLINCAKKTQQALDYEHVPYDNKENKSKKIKQLELQIEQNQKKLESLNKRKSLLIQDYDDVPYEKIDIIDHRAKAQINTQKILNRIDDYDEIPVDTEIKSGYTLSVNQIEQNRQKLENLNKLKKQTTKIILFNDHVEFQVPNFHSTHLEHSSINATCQFQPMNNNKAASTFNRDISSSFYSVNSENGLSRIDEATFEDYEQTMSRTAFSNSQYESPEADRKSYRSQGLSTSRSTFQDTQEFTASFTSHDFQSANSDFFDESIETEVVYVCKASYSAQAHGDLSLRFTDRVHILQVNGNYALVRNVFNQECGHVPVKCLQTLDEFMRSI